MQNPIVTKQALDPCTLSPHTNHTRGQFRGGGVGTSNSRRRSSSLGRVAVTMSKASPKSGGALGLLKVPNTRRRPVPPLEKGAWVDRLRRTIFNTLACHYSSSRLILTVRCGGSAFADIGSCAQHTCYSQTTGETL